MTGSSGSSSLTPPFTGDQAGSRYQPGVCNIGPAEIERRRRVGHVGILVAVGLFIGLAAIGAPPILRFLVGLPAAAAASGYLQAWFKFCAGFGSRGVFNFGAIGSTEQVVGTAAQKRDRAKSAQIGWASLAFGVVTGLAAALFPH